MNNMRAKLKNSSYLVAEHTSFYLYRPIKGLIGEKSQRLALSRGTTEKQEKRV
ncbi:hypothetical protein [Psychromonas aquatilis]|uniref:Uncharacterized protein n=1 Tax=Psychromonas aquatilis TaxID=2005072 RepID=A0ABU9GM90_9GAMM